MGIQNGIEMKLSIILCACKNEREAKKIAEKLLESKLAACVSITKVKSLYWWKGRITKNNEAMMIIKTKKNLVRKIMSAIKRIHSYKTPEIIELDVEKTNKEYAKWLEDVTR